MGGGARGDIGWVGHGRGPLGALLARRRARRQILDATEALMTDQPIPARSQWLTWGRIIGVVVFVLGLFYPPTRLLALGYGIGWVIVE